MLMTKRSKRILLTESVNKSKLNKDNIKLFNKYKIDMSIRELSPKTIYNYETDYYAWLSYIYLFQDNKNVLKIDEDDLTEFFYYCKTEGNNSRRMKRRMASISAFYKHLRKKRKIKENPMEFIDRPKKDTTVVVQTFLTKKQVLLMKRKLKENGDKLLELYALFSLSTMARVNAVSNIKWKQIDFDNRVCNDVLEKEGKIVTLYFNEEVKELLLEIQEERKRCNIENEYVFITKYDNTYKKINTSTLSEWCKKIGCMIGIPTLHCHDFRHSSAQLLKVAGMPIETISDLLNHSGLDVTKKFYLRQDKKKMQSEKDKFEII